MATKRDGTGWTVARALRALPRDAHWEIDDGVLEMHEPPAPYHANGATRVCAVLEGFVRPGGLGRVLVGDAGFHLARHPDVLRAPDVAFVSAAKVRQIRDPNRYAEVPRTWWWRSVRPATGRWRWSARWRSTSPWGCARCG